MTRSIAAAALALILAGCGPAIPQRPARAAPPIPVPNSVPSGTAPVAVGAVMGQNARSLLSRFGTPQIDATEGQGRKLQFLGPTCVLDAYLYPPPRAAANRWYAMSIPGSGAARRSIRRAASPR